jgi:GAF domain-containing protein
MVVSEEIRARMTRIAREVQSRDDLALASDRIVAAAVDLFDGQVMAGISIAQRNRLVVTTSATAEVARRGDDLQAELGEGPCQDAIWSHVQVVTGDLANDERWQRWGPTMAAGFGIKSMLCTRLFTDEQQIGALNLYSAQPQAFDEEAQEVATLLAVHAATTIAAAHQVDGLKVANDRRTTIGKALGMIMNEYGLGDDQAFTVLQRLSSNSNRKLFDLAEEIVGSGGLSPGDPRQ